MDAAQALADLTEISSQVVAVVILDRDGSLLATTIPAPGVGARFVAGVGRLLEEAEREAQARGLGGALSQLEASTLEGSVFAVRSGGRLIAATTRPDPTVGLVLYDLKRCLESLDEAAAPGTVPARAPDAAPDPTPEPPPAQDAEQEPQASSSTRAAPRKAGGQSRVDSSA
jgi:predicted regulator of Ras-like GTPase activity (Roadblock/LC7/MglB family)